MDALRAAFSRAACAIPVTHEIYLVQAVHVNTELFESMKRLHPSLPNELNVRMKRLGRGDDTVGSLDTTKNT